MLILGLQKTTLLDYPHKVASTIFTGGCNFRCPYCHNGDLVLNPSSIEPFSEEDIFEHLNSKKKILDGVCITGGEATLQKDLYDFIVKVKNLGLLVKLDTNGTDPNMIKRLLDDHLVDYIAMDIKQCQSKYNDIALMNNFDISKINSSVETLLNSSIDYEFRTTVVKELHSKEDMVSIANWIKGCRAYYLQPYRLSEQVIDKRFSAPSSDDLNSFMDAILPIVPVVQIRGLE